MIGRMALAGAAVGLVIGLVLTLALPRTLSAGHVGRIYTRACPEYPTGVSLGQARRLGCVTP